MEARNTYVNIRCEECTITLQYVSVLLGLHVDGSPLISPTNLNWAYLCEKLLGIRPQEGELKGSVVKLSWLTHHFAQINNHEGNQEQVERFIRAWILRFIGGVLFVDKSSNKVSLRYLQFLHDLARMHGDLSYLLTCLFIHRDVQCHRL